MSTNLFVMLYIVGTATIGNALLWYFYVDFLGCRKRFQDTLFGNTIFLLSVCTQILFYNTPDGVNSFNNNIMYRGVLYLTILFGAIKFIGIPLYQANVNFRQYIKNKKGK